MNFDGIKELSLYNFRSYRFLEFPISSRFVIFTGENGAGKTNILEAISLFSSTRGLRKAVIDELLFNDCSSLSRWNINARVSVGANDIYLSTFISNAKRSGTIDGATISSLAKFEEIIWILWITPQVDQIFLAQNPIKRKFFDHLVSGINSNHRFRLNYISKLQKERLHILQHNPDRLWLNSIENQLSDLYITIYDERTKFINTISGVMHEYYDNPLTPIISCTGNFEDAITGLNEEDIKNTILEKLSQTRTEDCFKSTTSFGPHKTNWVTTKTNHISAENSSSGEQKSMLIILILSALRMYQTVKSGVPLLLLDDFMVHLDENKRTIFAKELQKLTAQVFLTGTDQSFFACFSPCAQFVKIKDSMIESTVFENKFLVSPNIATN